MKTKPRIFVSIKPNNECDNTLICIEIIYAKRKLYGTLQLVYEWVVGGVGTNNTKHDINP